MGRACLPSVSRIVARYVSHAVTAIGWTLNQLLTFFATNTRTVRAIERSGKPMVRVGIKHFKLVWEPSYQLFFLKIFISKQLRNFFK